MATNKQHYTTAEHLLVEYNDMIARRKELDAKKYLTGAEKPVMLSPAEENELEWTWEASSLLQLAQVHATLSTTTFDQWAFRE